MKKKTITVITPDSLTIFPRRPPFPPFEVIDVTNAPIAIIHDELYYYVQPRWSVIPGYFKDEGVGCSC